MSKKQGTNEASGNECSECNKELGVDFDESIWIQEVFSEVIVE